MNSDTVISLSYGSLALFTSILHNVFLIYHVDTFVSIYKIDKASFWIGETVFLVWNSFNDPLLGWLSDKRQLNIHSQESSPTNTLQILTRRLHMLTLCGPLFSLSFLLFWFSWVHTSVQFVVCLCLYDSFLTIIDLQHSALLADMAITNEARTKLNSYCSIFNAIGSISVFLSYFVWKMDSMVSFQVLCAILAVFSSLGFLLCTRVIQKHLPKHIKHEDSLQSIQYGALAPQQQADFISQKSDLKSYIKQVTGHTNFMWFSCMNLVQVFHCHFNSNFFPLFLETLLAGTVSPAFASFLLGISFVAPHINNLYFLSLCRRYGVYKVIQFLFGVKFLLSVLMVCLGPNFSWLLCIFIASNRVFTEGTCKLLNLVISDLVDEDYVIHQRTQTVSALVFGTANFFSKPGQTLAPLIGTWLLAYNTGHDIFQQGNAMGSMKLNVNSMTQAEQSTYKQGVFAILVYVPIACALIQLAVWSRFNLRGKRLKWVKSLRTGAKFSTV